MTEGIFTKRLHAGERVFQIAQGAITIIFIRRLPAGDGSLNRGVPVNAIAAVVDWDGRAINNSLLFAQPKRFADLQR